MNGYFYGPWWMNFTSAVKVCQCDVHCQREEYEGIGNFQLKRKIRKLKCTSISVEKHSERGLGRRVTDYSTD